MLALLTETPGALHGPEAESRMLEGANREGANDGIHGRPVPMVDGTSETRDLNRQPPFAKHRNFYVETVHLTKYDIE
jgi:hypothetical protein